MLSAEPTFTILSLQDNNPIGIKALEFQEKNIILNLEPIYLSQYLPIMQVTGLAFKTDNSATSYT